jgi:hypothetical protein
MTKLFWFLKLIKSESTFDRKSHMWNLPFTVRINIFQLFKKKRYANTSNS